MTTEGQAAAVTGYLELQVCSDCGTVQYPAREVCRSCLADALAWKQVENTGKVLSWTVLHASTREFFSNYLPWHVASVKLDCGVSLYAYIDRDCASSGCPVRLFRVKDALGQDVYVATAIHSSPGQVFDKLDELTGEAMDGR